MEVTTERLKFADEYPDLAGKVAQRLHTKKDEIPFIRKYFIGEKRSDSDISKKDRTIISRISCVNKDREGDSLLPDGVILDNYRNNPVVCWQHSYREPQHYIGKNIWIKEDEKGLIAKTVFANTQFADDVFRAYTEDLEGTGPLLSGFSVGFIPIEVDINPDAKDADAPFRVYRKWELLEYSCVGIPCSPESLTIAEEKGVISKGFKERMIKNSDIATEATDTTTAGDEIEAALDAAEAKVADEAEVEVEEKAEYNCECIECGHKLTSDKHCKDIKCPECGGTMRRAERPGPGQEGISVADEAKNEPDDHADIIERVTMLEERIAELTQRLPAVDEAKVEPTPEVEVAETVEELVEDVPKETVEELIKRVVEGMLSKERLNAAVLIALKKLRGIVE